MKCILDDTLFHIRWETEIVYNLLYRVEQNKICSKIHRHGIWTASY